MHRQFTTSAQNKKSMGPQFHMEIQGANENGDGISLGHVFVHALSRVDFLITHLKFGSYAVKHEAVHKPPSPPKNSG